MKKLRFKEDYSDGYDVNRIVEIFKNRDYDLSHSDALKAWEEHSDAWAAGWLILPENDDEVFQQCMLYLEKVEE